MEKESLSQTHQVMCVCLAISFFVISFILPVNELALSQNKKVRQHRTTTNKKKAKPPKYIIPEGIELDLEDSDEGKANWVKAASSDDYLILYSPKRLMRLSKNTLRVWTKRRSISKDKKDAGFMLELNEYNCETRMNRTVAMAIYDASGNRINDSFLSDYASTPHAEWEYVIPDTLGEEELMTICNSIK